MRIAKVVGVAVATVKDRRLEGGKCMLVAAADSTGQEQGTAIHGIGYGGSGRRRVGHDRGRQFGAHGGRGCQPTGGCSDRGDPGFPAAQRPDDIHKN